MTKRRVDVVVLCEDLQQFNFARHFLIERGFDPRKIRRHSNPQGRGAGEQFVREKYPLEVKEHRRISSYRSAVALVVFIDADVKTVQQRLEELDSELESRAQLRRQTNEKIAIFVPKRHIETWIYYLRGHDVDEQTDYKGAARGIMSCKVEVQKLARREYPPGWPESAPPALRAACGELSCKYQFFWVFGISRGTRENLPLISRIFTNSMLIRAN